MGEPARPAVSVRTSVKPEYIICLEDGKKLKMLKCHLMALCQMTPDDYRANEISRPTIRWLLPTIP
ncbi:ROS/MUCR transcriptional regulator family protein (plasmid) [Sphingobium sp. RAC03]|nr:ROS/MUCR transcriptional regulator family protein [Sphingobium sp. RAC03]